jgi:hypothetical protein
MPGFAPLFSSVTRRGVGGEARPGGEFLTTRAETMAHVGNTRRLA